MPSLHPRVREVTERIRERSRGTRGDYLARMAAQGDREPARERLSCTNFAHGFAASDRGRQAGAARRCVWPNLAIVIGLQRHAVGAPALERFPGADQAWRRARPAPWRSSPAACRRCATASRRASPAWSCRCSAATSSRWPTARGAVARHVRCRAVPGRLRQDRARPADRRAVLRPSAGDLRAGRPDALRHRRTRRRRASASSMPRARPTAQQLLESEASSYHARRHLHVLRHRQQQPDADGGHGPASAGQRLRAARTRRCATR